MNRCLEKSYFLIMAIYIVYTKPMLKVHEKNIGVAD